ncbi:hypothetical protein Bca52824_063495 [Brassica carinata]|uniref:Uncharacterized protein n=1 Tax=Brassica carinata TaxID=52824 RepID=A0A8X7QEV1_BRACI|nr:hypothetical protein Bca52824_063495 [Brassica carinata]
MPSPEPLKPPLKSSIFALSSSPPSSALPDLWKKIVHGGSGSGVKARSWRGRRGEALSAAFCVLRGIRVKTDGWLPVLIRSEGDVVAAGCVRAAAKPRGLGLLVGGL